jgi:hypothetical protein
MDEKEEATEEIKVYLTCIGRRYRVGEHDDGNYHTAEEALWAAENRMKHNQAKGTE